MGFARIPEGHGDSPEFPAQDVVGFAKIPKALGIPAREFRRIPLRIKAKEFWRIPLPKRPTNLAAEVSAELARRRNLQRL